MTLQCNLTPPRYTRQHFQDNQKMAPKSHFLKLSTVRKVKSEGFHHGLVAWSPKVTLRDSVFKIFILRDTVLYFLLLN